MFWAGIIGGDLVGPVRVTERVKIDSEAYCNLLEAAFFLGLRSLLRGNRELQYFSKIMRPHSFPSTHTPTCQIEAERRTKSEFRRSEPRRKRVVNP